jgi:RNA recognition motif-containing protein
MTRVYVANVSSKVDYDELKELLGECGKIKSFGVKDGSGFVVTQLFLT